jgi:excisionase family DNA binding protein
MPKDRHRCRNEVKVPSGEPTKVKTLPVSLPALFDNEKRLLTVEELAHRLNVCRASVYVLISEQGLPRVKLGRAVRFQWGEVEMWLSKRSLT